MRICDRQRQGCIGRTTHTGWPGLAEKGQDLIEFALILPVLLLLLLGLVDFGYAVFAFNSIANAAREGARYGVIHPDDSAGIIAAARASAIGLDPAALDIDVTQPDADTIQVEVSYGHNLVTGPVIEVVGGNPSLPLHTVATMQIE